jgi:asparagine synthase (glutamine-hydrolysing)
MSGLAGWFGRQNDAGISDNVLKSLSRFGSDTTFKSGCSIASLMVAGLKASVSSYEDDRLIVVATGYPRMDNDQIADSSFAQRLAGAYMVSGLQVLQRVKDHFALAIVDKKNNEAVVAADRAGIWPMYYGMLDNLLVFGTDVASIKATSLLDCEQSNQAIYDYLYFHVVPAPESIYRDVHRLLPGEYLHYKTGGTEKKRFWKLSFSEHAGDFNALKSECLQIIENDVRRAATDDRVGAFLSGGIDSSTVAGMLGRVSKARPATYSIGFNEEEYNELGYARITGEHFNCEQHEYLVTPEDVVDLIPKLGAVHAEPFGNSSAVPAYYCCRLAKQDGMHTLLGGDGGDELFAGNARYAKQWVFSQYQKIPQVIRSYLLEPAAFAIPSGDSLPVLGKVRNYIRYANQPMPDRMERYNLLERIGAQNILQPDFLASVSRDNPLHLLRDIYDGADAKTMVNRMLALDQKFTIADNDIPKVSRSAELAGMAVRYPLLSDDLYEFSARVPSSYKLKGTHLRYFFKESVRGFLPDATLTKSKHGFGLPFGVWMVQHQGLHNCVMDHMSDLRNRNIIRKEFIDELMQELLPQHPGYYGTMVWVLLMLEQWFRVHKK